MIMGLKKSQSGYGKRDFIYLKNTISAKIRAKVRILDRISLLVIELLLIGSFFLMKDSISNRKITNEAMYLEIVNSFLTPHC